MLGRLFGPVGLLGLPGGMFRWLFVGLLGAIRPPKVFLGSLDGSLLGLVEHAIENAVVDEFLVAQSFRRGVGPVGRDHGEERDSKNDGELEQVHVGL